MRLLKTNDGYALVTSLMFTFLSLALTSALLYLVISSTKTSGALRKYHSVQDAARGGADIMIKDLINNNIMYTSDGTFNTQMSNYVGQLTEGQINTNCLSVKLTLPTRQWPAACRDVSLKATADSYDLKFKLNSDSGPSYTVYGKIVDTLGYTYTDYTPTGQVVTVTTAGNTDLSSTQLEGGQVTSPAATYNPSQPHLYRIEVQAAQPTTAETSRLSVEYAY